MHAVKSFLLLFSLFFGLRASYAQEIYGTIKDENGAPVAFASVVNLETNKGTFSGEDGSFKLKLRAGNHTIQVSAIGYESDIKTFYLPAKKDLRIDFLLQSSTIKLIEAEIVANKKDKAREIMRNVRQNRKKYLHQNDTYKVGTYGKVRVITERFEPKDTIDLMHDTIQKKYYKRWFRGKAFKRKIDSLMRVAAEKLDSSDFYPTEVRNLKEESGFLYFKSPGKYKMEIYAAEDHTYWNGRADYTGNAGSISITTQADDLIPEQFVATNPYLLYEGPKDCDFNFYENFLSYPKICDKPILSPLAANGALSYSYNYEGVVAINGLKTYVLTVTPLFRNEPLFEGRIYIADETWHLQKVELSLPKHAIYFARSFRADIDFSAVSEGIYMPNHVEVNYEIKSKPSLYRGKSIFNFTNYEINAELPQDFNSGEVKKIDDEAYSRDSTYWSEVRPEAQTQGEVEFIHKRDSLKEYYSSDEYYHKLDSNFNKINIWTPFLGLGHRNREKKTEWFLGGVLNQINPLGIGGYRHMLPFYFNKEFDNDWVLKNNFFVDYGFKNNDIKGRAEVELIYYPRKFIGTSIQVGDSYRIVNNFASIQQIFSRSNYTRVQEIALKQRWEITNGLMARISFFYADQTPLTNLQLSNWSGTLFGELNEALQFDRYTRSEITLDLQYTHRQQYMYKGRKKLIFGSKYPVVGLIYRKGLPNIFNSEVNFDYLELNVSDFAKLGLWGTVNYRAQMGNFINKNSLRRLEHKFFRGSDFFFFSDPTQSFQLLGPTLSTANSYFQANGVHHFEGAILNKVPLLNRLKLQIAVGAGTLLIPDSKFAHAEVFAGLERPLVLWQQRLRLGVYAVTSDNTFDRNANFTLKVGINFFNAFTERWDY